MQLSILLSIVVDSGYAGLLVCEKVKRRPATCRRSWVDDRCLVRGHSPRGNNHAVRPVQRWGLTVPWSRHTWSPLSLYVACWDLLTHSLSLEIDYVGVHIGAIIAAAGMQVYIVCRSVGLFYLVQFLELIIFLMTSWRTAERKTISNFCFKNPWARVPIWLRFLFIPLAWRHLWIHCFAFWNF